jgi:hypothetical protein
VVFERVWHSRQGNVGVVRGSSNTFELRLYAAQRLVAWDDDFKVLGSAHSPHAV